METQPAIILRMKLKVSFNWAYNAKLHLLFTEMGCVIHNNSSAHTCSTVLLWLLLLLLLFLRHFFIYRNYTRTHIVLPSIYHKNCVLLLYFSHFDLLCSFHLELRLRNAHNTRVARYSTPILSAKYHGGYLPSHYNNNFSWMSKSKMSCFDTHACRARSFYFFVCVVFVVVVAVFVYYGRARALCAFSTQFELKQNRIEMLNGRESGEYKKDTNAK